MFLRSNSRIKDGKTHVYWSVVENRRVAGGRIVQREVLYLGEINDSQQAAWRKTIEVFDEAGERHQVALFDERAAPEGRDVVAVKLSELQLRRPRQWGACWLAMELWQQLELQEFWEPRLEHSRKGTEWTQVLQTLTAYRLIDPGSEWRLHRQWFDASAMGDLLQADFAVAEKNTLYRCLDRLVEHKDELFKFLCKRWGEMFGARFDVLLYDLTSTYFETDTAREPEDLRQYGYSRDKRSDCRQVVIALIVTPEGFPLSYEVMAGNTRDSKTLSGFLERIEKRYGRANRIWVMDRGVPTEQSLEQMRVMGASYLVGTPKGRLTKLEKDLLRLPWQKVRDGISVKRLASAEDNYVFAQSDARIDKERAMRRRRLKRYLARLAALSGKAIKRDELLMKIGAARHEAGRAAQLVKLTLPGKNKTKGKGKAKTQSDEPQSFRYALDRDKLRKVRRREGRYLLRTNLTGHDPNELWTFYVQLTEVEQAFKELKNDLSVRPIYHQQPRRIEAHILVSFLAYCLQVTLKAQLRQHAKGLTPRAVIEKFKTMQMVDVHLPTTDGREFVLSRYTQPEREHRMLLTLLRLRLPAQPPPKITAKDLRPHVEPTAV